MVTILSKELVDNVLRRLMLAFQYKPSTEREYNETFALYYNSFNESGMTEKQLLDVSGRIIFSWKPNFGVKFPSVKEFIDLAGISASSIADKAHGYIKSKIVTVGGYEPIDFGKEHRHLVAMECIRRMGSWFVVCQKGIHEWEMNKTRFKTLFEELYYTKDIPKKPLLGGSNEVNTRFLAEYNKNQIEAPREPETHH